MINLKIMMIIIILINIILNILIFHDFLIIFILLISFLYFKLYKIYDISLNEIISNLFFYLIINNIILWSLYIFKIIFDYTNNVLLFGISVIFFLINFIFRYIYYLYNKPKDILIYKKSNCSIDDFRKYFKRLNIKIGKIILINNLDEIKEYRFDYLIVDSVSSTEDLDLILKIGIEKEILLYLSPVITPYITKKIILINDIPYIKIKSLVIEKGSLKIKRILDILLSSSLLMILFPLLILFGVLVKITSIGPVIYKQKRITKGGKIFTIYKFRSMFLNEDTDANPMLTKINDKRITLIGRLMRKSKIDELPQLINVLKGDMSIVGPRPERPYYVNLYNETVPNYNLRHSIKSGITGLSHIYGDYYTSPNNRLVYDLLYIYNFSILLDIKIILKTLVVIIKFK